MYLLLITLQHNYTVQVPSEIAEGDDLFEYFQACYPSVELKTGVLSSFM
jgi:hypothetical protein